MRKVNKSNDLQFTERKKDASRRELKQLLKLRCLHDLDQLVFQLPVLSFKAGTLGQHISDAMWARERTWAEGLARKSERGRKS